MSRSDVGPHAGATSKITLALRDKASLTPAQREQARKMRRAGMSMEAIAAALGVPLLSVSHALANLRMPRPVPPRYSLNVSPAAKDHVAAQRRPGEPIWKTVNRIFGIV